MTRHQIPDTSALKRICERVRHESEALLVVAIRTDDVAFSVDPGVSPHQFGVTLENEIPAMVQALAAQRTPKGANHADPQTRNARQAR